MLMRVSRLNARDYFHERLNRDYVHSVAPNTVGTIQFAPGGLCITVSMSQPICTIAQLYMQSETTGVLEEQKIIGTSTDDSGANGSQTVFEDHPKPY